MEDLLTNENDVKLIKSRILNDLPKINEVIKNLVEQIDPTLFNTFDDIKRIVENDVNKFKLSQVSTNDTAAASIEEIDEFFREFNYDGGQLVTNKPSVRGKKLIRAQSIHPSTSKPLSESRHLSGSLQSLTPSSSMSGTISQQNINSLNFEQVQVEIDPSVLKKIKQIKLNSLFEEDISTNYGLELEQFNDSCYKLDKILSNLKMPKEENIKTLIVNPETNRLTVELLKTIKNLISILHIDLNQINNIFDCDGDPFPLYEVLTELYQLL